MSNLEDALKTERVIYSEETIKTRVLELGRQITEDYKGKEGTAESLLSRKGF